MMSGGKGVSMAQAGEYFTPEADYYTKNMSNRDRWHGEFAKELGLKGEVSQEQFQELLSATGAEKKKRAAVDYTFSAPKSVSLAMAKDESTRTDMIEAHQAAVKSLCDKLEVEYIGAKVKQNGHENHILTRNMCAAEFVHYTARPTKENDYIPDLDLHSHIVIVNETFADGKTRACDYGKIARNMKDLGLDYRIQLAQELQSRGYRIVVTDEKQGFFELEGVPREVIKDNSHRRAAIEKTVKEHGMTDLQKANQFSRETKSKAKASFEQVLQATHKDIFDSGKVEIEKDDNDTMERNGKDESNRTRIDFDKIEVSEPTRRAGLQHNSSTLRTGRGELPGNFADRPSLPELQERRLDIRPGERKSRLLLSETSIHDLAELQAQKVRTYYMRISPAEREREARRAERAERAERVKQITQNVIHDTFGIKFAVTAKELNYNIRAACIACGVTEAEAKKIIAKAGLVKIGQMERDGKLTREQYITTEQNIAQDKKIQEYAHTCKNRFAESKASLSREDAEQVTKNADELLCQKGTFGFDWHVSQGEQGRAVADILSCKDSVCCVQGLAGTGKTTMLTMLNEAAQMKGIEVIGAAYTGKAKAGLQDETGIQSYTIHGFLNALESGKFNADHRHDKGRVLSLPHVQEREADRAARLEQNHGVKDHWDLSRVERSQVPRVLVVDEAGLVNTNLAAELLAACDKANIRVALLGDYKQLAAVGAGEPFKTLVENGVQTSELTDIRRQKNLDLLRDVQRSVDGDHLLTFESMDKRGDYIQIKSQSERRAAIVADVCQEKLHDYVKVNPESGERKPDFVFLTSTNAERRYFNAAIRAEYVKRGELDQGTEITVTASEGSRQEQESRHMAPGDRIIFKKNDSKRGLNNGDLAIVEKVTPEELTAKLDNGKNVTVKLAEYNNIDHAYALTNYAAQGMTVNRVIADMSTAGAVQSRNSLYVDISRARQNARVYTDNKEKLEKQTRSFVKKQLGKDFERVRRIQKAGRVQAADRYKEPPRDRTKEMQIALAQVKKHTVAPPPPRREREQVQTITTTKTFMERNNVNDTLSVSDTKTTSTTARSREPRTQEQSRDFSDDRDTLGASRGGWSR